MKKNAKNNITELVFILDRSGSMCGLESDTIGGFNAMLEKQKKQEGKCYVSTVLFDRESEVLHDRLDLADVPEMTEKDYCAKGCTALIDAIGGAVHHIGNIHKYAREEDVPAHTLFVITTDGLENMSHRYSGKQVKEMVQQRQKADGWEFLFIGANIDAVETADDIGIQPDRAVNYHSDEIGTRVLFETVANAACHLRADLPIEAGWSREISEDFESRKKKK